MNEKQEKAANRLRLALNYAGKCGLTGGVFCESFCVWPEHSGVCPGERFFDDIRACGGEVLFTPEIDLDGGAGV